MPNSLSTNYKYLSLLTMLYFTIMIISVVMIYKLEYIGGITVSASSLVIPCWYALGDVIAEVYGYKISRQLIWGSIICEFVFIFICAGLTQIQSPANSSIQFAYNGIFLQLPRVFLGSITAIFVGGFLNVYVLTKWKLLINGGMFWLRSIVSTLIGEITFVFIAFTIEFLGKIPIKDLLGLMLVSYGIKVVLAPILVIPANILCNILKGRECIDTNDQYTNFNPFKFNSENT